MKTLRSLLTKVFFAFAIIISTTMPAMAINPQPEPPGKLVDIILAILRLVGL